MRLSIIIIFAILFSSVCLSQVPVANFSFNPNPTCAGSNVCYQDLSSNSPTAWSYTLAGATPSISTVSNPVVTYNSAGVYTIMLVASNGTGSSVPSVKTITIAPPPISPAITGSCQNICATTATLNAVPPSVGTGTWSLISGSGVILAPNQPTTTVNSISIGTNVFLWSIANPGCISSATTCVIRNPPPTVSNAGPSQTICVIAGSAIITGNTPAVGVGTWSVVSGSGTISSPNSPSTTITGLSIGTTIVQWAITSGCSPASTSTMAIVVSAMPTISNAGPSQTICATSTTLNANTPTTGSGIWTLVSGTATINSPGSPNTIVSGMPTGSHIFAWTISNGLCTPSSSTVGITVNSCGIENSRQSEVSINVWPNPNKGEFSVSIPVISNGMQLEIFNGIGQLVNKTQIKESNVKVNINNLPDGIYHVRIISDNKQVYKTKIIKE